MEAVKFHEHVLCWTEPRPCSQLRDHWYGPCPIRLPLVTLVAGGALWLGIVLIVPLEHRPGGTILLIWMLIACAVVAVATIIRNATLPTDVVLHPGRFALHRGTYYDVIYHRDIAEFTLRRILVGGRVQTVLQLTRPNGVIVIGLEDDAHAPRIVERLRQHGVSVEDRTSEMPRPFVRPRRALTSRARTGA